jgi:hypothetical protein
VDIRELFHQWFLLIARATIDGVVNRQCRSSAGKLRPLSLNGCATLLILHLLPGIQPLLAGIHILALGRGLGSAQRWRRGWGV